MSRIHEPKRTSTEMKKLQMRRRDDPSFSTLVSALHDVMYAHAAPPNRMRAALRLLCHDEEWRNYRKLLKDAPVEEQNVEEDGDDPLEI